MANRVRNRIVAILYSITRELLEKPENEAPA